MRLLATELSPFVDGAGLAIVLRGLSKDTLREAWAPKLVDAFATRAVDDLARTLVALACGKKKMVPARCEELVGLLEADVERAREVMGEARAGTNDEAPAGAARAGSCILVARARSVRFLRVRAGRFPGISWCRGLRTGGTSQGSGGRGNASLGRHRSSFSPSSQSVTVSVPTKAGQQRQTAPGASQRSERGPNHEAYREAHRPCVADSGDWPPAR
jgi:hypothetical protein